MKKSLGDLNEYLFDQLNALSNQDLEGDKLKEAILRSRAIDGVARNIIKSGRLVLDAKKFQDSKLDESVTIPKTLEG